MARIPYGINGRLIKKEVYKVINSLLPKPYLTPSEVVDKYMFTRYQGVWIPYYMVLTEYMREPLDLLGTYEASEIIFMGRSRTGKSEALIKGAISYAICYSYADVLLVHLNEDKAVEFGANDLKPTINASPGLAKFKLHNQDSFTNTRLRFSGQNIVSIRWPTKSSLAAISTQYALLTDYDRWELNIDGEGDGFTLAKNRTQTFGIAGKTIAESSPGHAVINPRERLPSDHFAPTSTGIAALYNDGDRRRYYFKCTECKEWFIARWEVIKWDNNSKLSIRQKAKTAYIECPHCKARFDDKARKSFIANGKWIKDGEKIDCNDNVTSEYVVEKSQRASFWLCAPATAFNTLPKLVESYLLAYEDYKNTKFEFKLQAFFNTSVGIPYIPREYAQELRVNRENLRLEGFKSGYVPSDTICLIAAVDVQGGAYARFVVQIHALTVEHKLYVTDRFEISSDLQGVKISPDICAEDWNILEARVFEYVAFVEGYPNIVLRVGAVVIDSGGLNATTQNAYRFYNNVIQKLKAYNPLLTPHFFLVKGEELRKHSLDYYAYIKHKEPHEKKNPEQPDIMLWVNSHNCKMQLNALLQLKGYVNFTEDTPDKVLDQLEAEEIKNGKYQKVNHSRQNETLDLLVYTIGYIKAIVDPVAFVHQNLQDVYREDINDNNSRFKRIDQGNPFFLKDTGLSATQAMDSNRKNRTAQRLSLVNAYQDNQRIKRKGKTKFTGDYITSGYKGW